MTILFDFDEVFVDINTGALEYINNKLGTKYVLDDIKSWEFFNDPKIRPSFVEFLGISNVYQTLAIPNFEMINNCKQLINMGEDVYIVTASLEHSHNSKLQFIREYMPFISLDRVFVINESSPYKYKSDVLAKLPLNYRKPIVLVDDGIHNILDMMADIKHKDKLERTMRQFYHTKLLQKYNNPYHDFIYGIVPELTYNRDLDDGKRIFKIKTASELWPVLDNIKNSHNYRISSKEHEIIGYLHNLLAPYIMDANSIHGLHSNFTYLMNSCFAKTHEYSNFLTEIGKLAISVQNSSKSINEKQLFSLFDTAESLFSSVMYDDIKELVFAHSLNHTSIPNTYNILDSEGISVLSALIRINQRNVELVDNVVLLLSTGTPYQKKTLYSAVNHILFNPHTGINNIECLANLDYLKANMLLILNKNVTLLDNKMQPMHLDIEDSTQVLSKLFTSLTQVEPSAVPIL